jgi:S1-C subfamily serine protease
VGGLELGLEVAAYGYPQGDALGSGLKFTKGAISDQPNASLDNMILLDLRINSGNSGGPLCDRQGRVVGMITAKTSGVEFDSYGMAIPANELVPFLEENLPDDATRGVARQEASDWTKVTSNIKPAVLMILKTK